MENLNQENAMKMKHFEHAIDCGELDHLITDPTARTKTKLWRLADETLKTDSTGISELQDLQSIIGMVHTLAIFVCSSCISNRSARS